jgi:hypothetical protein
MAGVYKQGTFATSGNEMGIAPRVTPPKLAEARRAVRTVASMSRDVVECAEVLAMLGLNPADGKI